MSAALCEYSQFGGVKDDAVVNSRNLLRTSLPEVLQRRRI